MGDRAWVAGRLGFFVINAVSLAIPIGCLAVSRSLLELDSDLADGVSVFAVGLPLATAARFWAIRKFIFLRPVRKRARSMVEGRTPLPQAAGLGRVGADLTECAPVHPGELA